jgi:hypothetical protein
VTILDHHGEAVHRGNGGATGGDHRLRPLATRAALRVPLIPAIDGDVDEALLV